MNRVALTGLVFAALTLAGCAGRAAGPTGPTAGEQAVQQSTQKAQDAQCEAGKEAWRTAGAPKRGGIWRYSSQVPHLDPSAPDGRWYYHAGAYEYLAKPRMCYYSDMTVAPDLAKSWDISADATTWTLKLRDDVKWQNLAPVNGRAFTSADVAWTIEYHQKGGGGLKSVWEGVVHEEPDLTTVVLKFKEPRADFLGQLADEHNVMLPREVKEQKGDFKGTLVGTGPFMLKEFKPDQALVLEKNPSYYLKGADGLPLPYLDGIQQTYFADYSAEVAAMRSGQLDRNYTGGFRKLDADALKAAGIKLRSFDNPAANVFGVWMKGASAPWNDVKVRRAVSLAIDRDDIIAAEAGGAVQQGFLPLAVGGEYAWPPEKTKATFKADLAQAKKLLAETGFTRNATPFVLKTSQGYSNNAEVVQKQLEALGMNVKIDLAPGVAVSPVLAKRDFDLAFGPWSGGRLPDFWLGEVVRSGGARNITGYGDPKLDAMISAQVKEVDAKKRKVLLDQIQDYLVENMPYVPTITRIYYHFESCRVRNIRNPHNSGSTWGASEAWLDPQGC